MDLKKLNEIIWDIVMCLILLFAIGISLHNAYLLVTKYDVEIVITVISHD